MWNHAKLAAAAAVAVRYSYLAIFVPPHQHSLRCASPISHCATPRFGDQHWRFAQGNHRICFPCIL
ncbi:hypothetical protein RSAG8_05452, partial [Rhizoctonia solani AG-8 WAC10335]